MNGMQVRDPFQWAYGCHEFEQMLRRAAVTADGIERRAADMLVMIEPAISQRRKRNCLESQGAGGTGLQLAIDLGSQRAGRLLIKTDSRLAALTLFKVSQIPDLAAKECADAADPKGREFLGHKN